MKLEGKVALVTGTSPNIGGGIVEALAGAGAAVVAVDARSENANCCAAAIRAAGGRAIGITCDVTDEDAVRAAVEQAVAEFGQIDILVNNAVVRHFAPVEAFAPEHWEEALAVNLSAPFHLIRLALPAMKKRGWGRIFNMASIYSTRAVADRIDYVTTKTAILGMTRAVAIETTASGITCNALCPGTLPTLAITQKIASIAAASARTIDETTRDYLAARQPTGRFVALEAVGAMVVFLASEAARDITGATLPIDGGWSIA